MNSSVLSLLFSVTTPPPPPFPHTTPYPPTINSFLFCFKFTQNDYATASKSEFFCSVFKSEFFCSVFKATCDRKPRSYSLSLFPVFPFKETPWNIKTIRWWSLTEEERRTIMTVNTLLVKGLICKHLFPLLNTCKYTQNKRNKWEPKFNNLIKPYAEIKETEIYTNTEWQYSG